MVELNGNGKPKLFCTVKRCGLDHYGKGLCKKHYLRQWRHGSTHSTREVLRFDSNGYLHVRSDSHPLSVEGWVSMHRLVVHDSGRPLVCFNCGKQHTWKSVCIDHIDDDITNNDISNLQPACATCNVHKNRTRLTLTLDINDWAKLTGIERKTIDRRLADGWSTHDVLMRPVRKARTYTHAGKTMTLDDWATKLGVPRGTLENRMRTGWSLAKTLGTPRKQ